MKLSVVGADDRGYEYYGSLIYQRNGSSLTFESAGFNEGRIYSGGACYHIKDHLGSIRLVMDQTGSVKEQNDYYPFGMRQERSNYALFAGNRFKYNGKEEQTTGGLGYLDYGARMYDAESGRWFGVDPLLEKYYGLSPYVYCGNNPLIYIDPDGQLSTHYVDKYYNVIFQSSDKSDDVIKVPDDRIADFLALLQASSWDGNRIHSSGFNDYLKGEYGLADYQFSEAQLNALDQFSTTWSRNNAARFMLNPTMGNALRMGWSEVLSQWTNPELVATGLSAGILGMKGMTRGGVKTNTLVVEDVAVHGNSLKSMRPTWGYKLYSNDGTFLKNGITSRLIPEKRYTKIFMSDKYMETIKFSNRIDAYNWEFNQNITGRGPLNFNNH